MSNENRKKSYRLHGKTSKRAVPSALQGVSVAIFSTFRWEKISKLFKDKWKQILSDCCHKFSNAIILIVFYQIFYYNKFHLYSIYNWTKNNIFLENNYIEIILCAKYMLIFYDMKINFLGCLRQCSLETRIFTIHFNFVSLGKM